MAEFKIIFMDSLNENMKLHGDAGLTRCNENYHGFKKKRITSFVTIFVAPFFFTITYDSF